MTRLIAFDVDSTLLRVESLDTALEAAFAALPDPATARKQLHEITNAGMSGRMALRDSLEARLKLAGLDKAGVDMIAQTLRQRITPGMSPLIRKLRERGDALHAVSGGFADLIEPVLEDLGFQQGDIHANRFVWQEARVVGLDIDCPLSRNGGKAEVLDKIAASASETIVVGDGMTDFEAFENGAADRFIGFGAIAKRDVVIAACEYSGADYVRSVADLAKALGV
ncbi:MAG: HAD-IB family phosphatase [Alphaproteobacteria bacterium]|uniref:HAD-IB family phosphatase n=1 Tax=Maricaulis alexandrii TaxID=2570354 RepID=UPI001486954F|nr:HAD-IB family phosphatase [Maricaulis alexandrii]MCR9266864.1 HAD-IB family phosphatase [Alphaproteobacteria bacterium]